MRTLIASLLLLTMAAAANAQKAPPPGDTLRFESVTLTSGEVETPMGPQKMTMEMRIQMAMTGLGGDSAATWVDSISASGPIPGLSEKLAEMRGKRTVVRFRPDGKIEADGILQGLNLGAGSPMSSTGLNFGLAMRGQLARGHSWTDTTNTQVDTLGASIKGRTITRYEVMGDTTYDGLPVKVIRTSLETLTNGSTGNGTMAMSGKGTGSGRIYFDTQLGMLVNQTLTMQDESSIQVADMSMTSRNTVQMTTRMLRRR